MMWLYPRNLAKPLENNSDLDSHTPTFSLSTRKLKCFYLTQKTEMFLQVSFIRKRRNNSDSVRNTFFSSYDEIVASISITGAPDSIRCMYRQEKSIGTPPYKAGNESATLRCNLRARWSPFTIQYSTSQ